MKLLERHVQEAVVSYLQLDGWRPIRTEHAIERNTKGGFKRRVGEVGMPDYLFIRYLVPQLSESWAGAQVMWIEFKKLGAATGEAQNFWHRVEAKRGALVIVVDEYDPFREWYEKSGLCRRKNGKENNGTAAR